MSAAASFSCPFCASPPFTDFDNYSPHFINVHRSSLFPDPNFWGVGELRTLAELVTLFEKYFGLYHVNIKLSTLVGCDTYRIKKTKELLGYKQALAFVRNPQVESSAPAPSILGPSLIDLEPAESCDTKAADLSHDISVIIDEVRDISNILKDNVDSVKFSESLSSSFNALLPFKCLFCDRRFSTSSGLGLHKKSKHFHEFLLEIELKYANRRNHPWDEEELRILYTLEQDLISKSVKHVNIELAKLLTHREYSHIVEIRKSKRYKNLKEKLCFESASGGASPPSPATLLFPNAASASFTAS